MALVPLTACGGRGARTPAGIAVTVAAAARQDVPYEIEASGTVEPRQTAAVESQVSGLVTRVAFREGEDVRQGQLLFQIDPRPFEVALAQAQAMWLKDSAQAAQAARDAARYAELAASGDVTHEQEEGKRADAAALAAQVRADSAVVLTARLNLEYAAVRAPIPGRTGTVLVRTGNLVHANSPTPLVVINQIRPILVRFAVPQTDLPLIRRYGNQDLPVRAWSGSDPEHASSGKLTFIDNAVDTSTGTVLLKAEFPNQDQVLWPGEFVTTRLQLYVEHGATVVPTGAVTRSQSGTFVYVVNHDSSATMRPVTVSRTAGPVAVIATGVQPGETVVTDGQLRLATGSRVSIKSTSSVVSGDSPAPAQ